MAQDRQVLSERLAAFLGEQYDAPGRDKKLAQDLGVDPRSARNYFAGHWPSAHAFRAIVRKFGRDVLAAVFDPDIDETAARLRAEVAELEGRLERKKEALRAVDGR